MSAKRGARADVFKQRTRIGELERTQHGARFTYSPEFLGSAKPRELGLAFTMPPRPAPYEVFGTNLHPFFAGLLPEGLRLRALVRAVKTSEDDLFSLLAASGADTVGDIEVAPHGSEPEERAPIADISRLNELSFRELLEASLRYEQGQADAAIAGVQPKVSAAMISFPVRASSERRSYILKLTPAEFPRIVENEAFFMELAKGVGLKVARTRVVHDRDGTSALLVERFDRAFRASAGFERLHQEDACQLLDRYPADKYRLSFREIAGALEVCSAPLAERLKLLRMQAYAYAIANGDLHAKNVSVRVVGSRVELTPCYDMLSTLPYGDRTLALAMEGRDDKLKRAHFLAASERLGLRALAIEQMLDRLVQRLGPSIARLGEIGLDAKQTRHLERTMQERLAALAG